MAKKKSPSVEDALRHKVEKINPDPSFINRLATRLRTANAAQSVPPRQRVPIWAWGSAAVALLFVMVFVTQTLLPSGVPANPTPDTPSIELEPAFAATLPPAIVNTEPRPGAEVNQHSDLLLHFTRPMDRASVEAALTVSPDVEGDFNWVDDTRVAFTPKKALASGMRYEVTLGSGARANNGQPINRTLTFDFTTVGPLTVTHTSPADASNDIRTDAALLVSFNYPVAPLTCSGRVAESDSECPPLPLQITPDVAGEGMWVNTSLYRFDPHPAWNAGTTYSVTLPAGQQSVDGATLADSFSFIFNSVAPNVSQVTPLVDEANLPLESAVRVTFNTPMDHTATEAAFSLRVASADPLEGTFSWEDDGTVLVFTPTQQLQHETVYSVDVQPIASSLGGTPLANAHSSTFTTVPPLRLLEIKASYSDAGSTIDYYEPIQIEFAGIFDPTSLERHITVTRQGEAVSGLNIYWDTDTKTPSANLEWDKESGLTYCVHVLPGGKDSYGNTLATESEACFTVNDMPSLFNALNQQRALTLDAAEIARLYFVAVNVDAVTSKLYRINEKSFIPNWAESYEKELLRELPLTPSGARNESVVVPVDLAAGQSLPTGYYLLDWLVPNDEDEYTDQLRFAVVDRHLTLKISSDEALVWVTDLHSGAPLANVEVRLLDLEGETLGQANSDADGLARFAIPKQSAFWDEYLAVSGTPGQPGFGVAHSDWNQDVRPWNFDIESDYSSANEYQIYLHTDRPIYRPGQTVYFHGVVRADDGGQYILPDPGTTLQLNLFSYSSEFEIPALEMKTSATGNFEGKIELPADAPLGSYQISLEMPEHENAYWPGVEFAVAAYRKPEFEVTVTPAETDLLAGDTVRASVTASYYSGGTVNDARVHWTLRASPYNFNPATIQGWWQWARDIHGWGPWQESQVIAEGDASTDAAGHLLIEIPADLAPLDEEKTAGPQTWELEVTVVDETNFPVTGHASTVVHTGLHYLGLKPHSWVTSAGVPAEVDVSSMDWDAQPVSNQQVTLQLAQRAWTHEPSSKPFEDDIWTYEDTVVQTVSVTTDAQGEAVAAVTPEKSGAYVIIATGKDAQGNPVSSETSLWVSGPGTAQWRMPEGKITPLADAQSYRPGDVAQILLPTPFEAPYEVLMTLERDGFLDVQRFTATENSPLIEVPIDDLYAPNVIVSFVVVKGIDETSPTPDVRIGMLELEVDAFKQQLTVEITPDCQQPCSYAPGDNAALTIRTTDHSGAPVDAEIALAVVDKSVLALANDQTLSIEETFYAPHLLRVLTSDSLVVLNSRITADLEELQIMADYTAKEAMVGGMGGGGNTAMSAPDVRQDFPDTALWEASLRSGPSGETTVNLELPDSLTTWVVDARAASDDTLVGQNTAEFTVGKPLLVRPVTPRFLVAGDQTEVAAIVHNNTDTELDVRVELNSNLQSDDQQIVQRTLPAYGRVRVAWRVSVPAAGLDWAELTFSAASDAYRDAARPSVGRASDHALPIYRYETADVFATTGVLTKADGRLEILNVPQDAGPDTTLTLRLEPSLATAMTEGLSYLDNFEHASNEELVSRLLPNVVTYQALQTLGLDDPDLETKLSTLVNETLEKLYTGQNPDGGWGWWQGESQPQTSAYATLGLLKAQQAGFAVDAQTLQNALGYLEQRFVDQQPLENPTLVDALSLYVLAEAGQAWPEGVDEQLYDNRAKLEITGRAYLTLALHEHAPDDPRVNSLLEELRADVKLTATGAHWESEEREHWVTWTRATSVVVDALARIDAEDPLLPQAVRWLMLARSHGHWESTQETAWAVIALSDYMVARGELDSDYVWGVAFNETILDEGTVNADSLREALEYVIPASDMLRSWPNALEVSRDAGPGTLYYTADLAIYRPVAELAAQSNGFSVQRQYCVAQSAKPATPPGDSTAESFEACRSITTAHPGELVEVRLTLTLPEARQYVKLEDFYPAGLEAVDSTLKTEQSNLDPESTPDTARVPWWRPSFDHEELRDERAVFYAQRLAAGTYQVRYYLRAAIPGTYNAIPSTVEEVYAPDVRGRSDGSVFVIESE